MPPEPPVRCRANVVPAAFFAIGVTFVQAALIIKGPGGTKTEAVGVKLTLTAKGSYHITMVKQMPDDKHLTLKVT